MVMNHNMDRELVTTMSQKERSKRTEQVQVSKGKQQPVRKGLLRQRTTNHAPIFKQFHLNTHAGDSCFNVPIYYLLQMHCVKQAEKRNSMLRKDMKDTRNHRTSVRENTLSRVNGKLVQRTG